MAIKLKTAKRGSKTPVRYHHMIEINIYRNSCFLTLLKKGNDFSRETIAQTDTNRDDKEKVINYIDAWVQVIRHNLPEPHFTGSNKIFVHKNPKRIKRKR